ncbi:MAG: hypothetical protein QOH39_1601 [Verrucomicrobiota bacterium]
MTRKTLLTVAIVISTLPLGYCADVSGERLTEAKVEELLRRGDYDRLKTAIQENRVAFMQVVTPLAAFHSDKTKPLLGILQQRASNQFDKLMYIQAVVRNGRVDVLADVAKFESDSDQEVREVAADAVHLLKEMQRFFRQRFGLSE